MRYLQAALAAALLIHLPSAAPRAGEIYKWTDTDGVVFITNQPPPPQVRAPRVIPYAAPAPAHEPPRQTTAPSGQNDPALEKAREAVATARVVAEETLAAAEAEAAKLAPRNRKKRIVQQRRARLSAEAAEKAHTALVAAEENLARAEAAAAIESNPRATALDGGALKTGVPDSLSSQGP